MNGKSVDDITAEASKARDLLFRDLDEPVDLIHRQRILVVGVEEDLSRVKGRSLRDRGSVSGFIVVEWRKMEGFTALNNLALKCTRSQRLLLDLTLIALKVCVNQQKIESANQLSRIMHMYNYNDISSIPAWMYVQVPPPNHELIGLIRNEHESFFGKYKRSLGWTRMLESRVKGYGEWSINLHELEEIFLKNANSKQVKMYTSYPLSKYLEWRNETKVLEAGVLKYTQSRKKANTKEKVDAKPDAERKKKKKHCRCCGSSDCSGRGGIRFCHCLKPDCLRLIREKKLLESANTSNQNKT